MRYSLLWVIPKILIHRAPICVELRMSPCQQISATKFWLALFDMTLEDFKTQEIHDRGSADHLREVGRFSTVRAQSSGSEGDKSKKKPKYTDSKKASRPRESLEQVKISQIEWHGDWWIR
eukprot:5731330-Amphidinium_carterae.1